MYKLKYTNVFEKDLKKLTPTEQKAVANKLKLLIQNPFYPSLRTKKVQGLDNVFEMSVNMDIRILWRYESGVIIGNTAQLPPYGLCRRMLAYFPSYRTNFP